MQINFRIYILWGSFFRFLAELVIFCVLETGIKNKEIKIDFSDLLKQIWIQMRLESCKVIYTLISSQIKSTLKVSASLRRILLWSTNSLWFKNVFTKANSTIHIKVHTLEYINCYLLLINYLLLFLIKGYDRIEKINVVIKMVIFLEK